MSVADKLAIIAENENKVYKAGQKAERSMNWDIIQDKGKATNYGNVGFFSGYKFTFDNFYPKYDIRPEGSAQQLFYAWTKSFGSLTQRLKECGVVLDTSKATHLNQMFAYGKFSEIPTIDFSSAATNSSRIFAYIYDNLITIEKLIVNENTTYDRWFIETSVVNVIFEGVIGQNGLNLQWSNNLSIESLRSIISCLKDYSADISGTVWQVTIGSTNYAKLTTEDLENISKKGWVFV